MSDPVSQVHSEKLASLLQMGYEPSIFHPSQPHSNGSKMKQFTTDFERFVTKLTIEDDVRIVFLSVCILIGVPLNVFVLHKNLRKLRYLPQIRAVSMLKLQLNLSDLFLLIVYGISKIGSHMTVSWEGGRWSCKLVKVGQNLGFYLVSTTLACMGIDRLVNILSPNWNPKRLILILISTSLTYSLLCTVPQWFHWDVFLVWDLHLCMPVWTAWGANQHNITNFHFYILRFIDLSHVVTMFWVPLFVMMGSSSVILWHLWSRGRVKRFCLDQRNPSSTHSAISLSNFGARFIDQYPEREPNSSSSLNMGLLEKTINSSEIAYELYQQRRLGTPPTKKGRHTRFSEENKSMTLSLTRENSEQTSCDYYSHTVYPSKRVFKMCVFLHFAYAILWLPYHLVLCFPMILTEDAVFGLDAQGFRIAQAIFDCMLLVNSVVNPLIYGLATTIGKLNKRSTLNSEPVFHYVRGMMRTGQEKPEREWLYRGDVEGRVVGWRVPEVSDKSIIALQQESFKSNPELIPELSCSLHSAWSTLPEKPNGITAHMEENQVEITTTVYVGSQGRLILGRSDGSIVLLSATHALIKQLLSSPSGNQPRIGPDWPQTRILMGHNEAVTCLLYPHEEHPRYDPAHLLSGGADFAICFWNLLTGTRLHRFCVQAGPIIRLIVPPSNCNPRILQAVCSVAEDHSVALLGLKEQKCILLASRHLFPVLEIYWRPLDDFILVKCEDSTVYVWQMETGHLDRIVSGVVAEEIVNACQEQVGVAGDGEEDVQGASVSVQMFRAIRHKNVTAMKKIAGGAMEAAEAMDERNLSVGAPMLIQGLKTVHSDPESHVVLFNVESLIMGLLAEENSMGISGSSSETSMSQDGLARDASPSLSGLLALAKDKAEKALRSPTPTRRHGGSSSSSRSHRRESGTGVAVQLQLERESSLCMEVARVLMSLLHGWNLDKDLDKVCLGKLGLLPPKAPVCFGLVSRQGFLSVMLPSGIDNYRRAAGPKQVPTSPSVDTDMLWFTTRLHWQTSSTLTTQHLLAVIATANTLMSMSSAGFLPEQEKKRKLVKRMSTHGSQKGSGGSGISQEAADALTTEQGQIKQGWSLQAALHCVLLPELVNKDTYKPPRIELLARRWQERCLELREAAQALLLRELNRLGPKGRKALIDNWAPYLPTQLDPSLSIFGAYHFGGHPSNPSPRTPSTPTPATVSSPSNYHSSQDHHQQSGDHGVRGGSALGGGNFEPLLAASDAVVSGAVPPSDTSLLTVRKNQATAVVLLGVIGAEFGQEIAQVSRNLTPASLAPVGFSEKDYSLARATSQSLLELLIQPPSALLPPFSPLRRAAIDLLGRGFVVWQPYLDISKVLLGLLEMSANSDRLIPSPPVIFPLSPVSDGCRTARHALTLIATARPPAFITALSKEVARFNAASQHSTLQPGSSPIQKARPELLKIIEILTEKHYSDMVDLMVPLGEILVHCLDTSMLKSHSLNEVFPPITKFHMVCYCSSTRRIAFGSRNGTVVMHELRAGKTQTIHAHSRGVTACAFSEDGKHLATYSADEGKLNFWQASQSFLGMGQSQIKCVRQLPAPTAFPVTTPGGSSQVFKARLVWVGAKALTLLLPNGKETRFSM